MLSPALSEAATQPKLSESEIVSLGETPLSQSTQIGGVSRTQGVSSDSDLSVTCKRGRGRPSSMDCYLEMCSVEKKRKLETVSDKTGSMDSLMTMMLMMQKERIAAEDARAQERMAAEEEHAHKDKELHHHCDMQFMTLLSALINPNASSRSLNHGTV